MQTFSPPRTHHVRLRTLVLPQTTLLWSKPGPPPRPGRITLTHPWTLLPPKTMYSAPAPDATHYVENPRSSPKANEAPPTLAPLETLQSSSRPTSACQAPSLAPGGTPSPLLGPRTLAPIQPLHSTPRTRLRLPAVTSPPPRILRLLPRTLIRFKYCAAPKTKTAFGRAQLSCTSTNRGLPGRYKLTKRHNHDKTKILVLFQQKNFLS